MLLLDSLPYLNAVLMEGLRLVDTILSYETRLVPAGGCVIEGYHLPAGVRCPSHPSLPNPSQLLFIDVEESGADEVIESY